MSRDEREKQFSRGNEIVLGNIVIPNSSNRIPNSIYYIFKRKYTDIFLVFA